MVYQKFVKQLDGCTYVSGGLNCTCACHAMWLYRASQGRINITACTCRKITGDTVGGTRLTQMREVSLQYGIPGGALWLPGEFDELRRLILTGRYGSHVNVGYRPLANTDYDCFDGNFTGAHDLYITSGTANYARIGDPGADGRRATVPEGWQDIPWDLLERAAGALPLTTGGATLTQEHGAGKVFAYLTPADPVIPLTKYIVSISGYTPLYSAPGGARVGAVSLATYLCTRSKVAGLWWYRILSKKDGTKTANAGRYFKPNRYTEARLP